MKKLTILKPLLLALMASPLLTSCERIRPNHVGVLMENFGKSGKADYSVVTGKVSTWGAGLELWQVPMWEQRTNFGDQTLRLKAADNTEFTARPNYIYHIEKDRAVDVVFNNARLGSGSDFMQALQDNVLEGYIYDIMKEESRRYTTDSLMANGGSLGYERRVEALVKAEFGRHGIMLDKLTPNLDFSDAVKKKIDKRNEVNTNVSVLDQQIVEQKKRNELATLEAEEKKIRSSGLTNEILAEKWIEKWNGTMYGSIPHFLKNVE